MSRRAKAAPTPAPAAPGRCKVTDGRKRCAEDVKVKKHEMCWAHYVRYTRTGDPGPVEIRERRELPTYRPRAV